MAHFSLPRSSFTNAAACAARTPLPTEEDERSSVSSTSSSSSSTILAPRSNRRRSSTARATQSQPNALTATNPQTDRRCWICFGEDADSFGVWVRPCECSLVAHEHCLLDWIAENQKRAPTKPVHCPQCASRYCLTERTNMSLALLGAFDNLIHTAAPYVTLLGVGCSVLITSTTYGAFTIMTLFGAHDGERFLGRPATWTWRAWLGLPLIPLTLITTRTRWSNQALPFAAVLFLHFSGAISALAPTLSPHMRLHWPPTPEATIGMLPWVRLFYNNLYDAAQRHLSRQLLSRRRAPNSERTASEGARGRPVQRNPEGAAEPEFQIFASAPNREVDVLLGGDMGMAVMGALLWPAISRLVGNGLSHVPLVRRYFPEPFHRNILGGCLFVVAKDVCNLFYKYQRVRQYQSRRVKNYHEIK